MIIIEVKQTDPIQEREETIIKILETQGDSKALETQGRQEIAELQVQGINPIENSAIV